MPFSLNGAALLCNILYLRELGPGYGNGCLFLRAMSCLFITLGQGEKICVLAHKSHYSLVIITVFEWKKMVCATGPQHKGDVPLWCELVPCHRGTLTLFQFHPWIPGHISAQGPEFIWHVHVELLSKQYVEWSAYLLASLINLCAPQGKGLY